MRVTEPIRWTPEGVVVLDQRRLPGEVIHHTYTDYRGVAGAIQEMVIRGAPVIGIAAAMGVAIGVQNSAARNLADLRTEFSVICNTLAHTRPTAADLFWAIQRCQRVFDGATREAEKNGVGGIESIRKTMIAEAQRIHQERRDADAAIGRFGAELMPQAGRVMTQCNAGALATGGIGTALGVIRVAIEGGRKIEVIVPETRPYLQGSRLTAWELQQDGIPLTLITDNMVGHILKTGNVSAIVVGADRIAANGDTANKIGTYPMAVLANEHKIPFYVAAPISTFDLSLPSGDAIPIEERSADEVTHLSGVRIAPDVKAQHPAFDVTPSRFIAAIITERGVARSPFQESLKKLAGAASARNA
ncbi:MAG: S-methyl-5-thioribose-1-phosphate isomerase [Candidatus Acidiferrales bacterium]